jgi:rubrerythrin
MTDVQVTGPVGASVWEQQLFHHLTTHVTQERQLLEEYVEAATATDSKALAYLVGILIDDERRHHQTFASLAASLKVEAALTGADPEVPRMDFDRVDRQKIREVTNRLLEREEADAKELKRLHNELHDVKDTTLWDLLVGIMRRDTDKHIAVLEFVLHHTR